VGLFQRVADGLPVVQADAGQLRQVFTNLIDNAMKFTPQGGKITVGVWLARPDLIHLEVSDTGPGIPEEFLSRIFNKFEQGKTQQVSGYHGTGLGLAICKGIVEGHGGRIAVRSRAGKGSTFYFELPVKAAKQAAAKPAAATGRRA
jgi:signal transduction histidine kinase